METIEYQEDAPKLRRRRVKEKTSTPSPIQESPERIAARKAQEAREAAERTMLAAILLIQSHERARMARCAGIDGEDSMNKLLFTVNNFNKSVKIS